MAKHDNGKEDDQHEKKNAEKTNVRHILKSK